MGQSTYQAAASLLHCQLDSEVAISHRYEQSRQKSGFDSV
jgi:hypothetical protein